VLFRVSAGARMRALGPKPEKPRLYARRDRMPWVGNAMAGDRCGALDFGRWRQPAGRGAAPSDLSAGSVSYLKERLNPRQSAFVSPRSGPLDSPDGIQRRGGRRPRRQPQARQKTSPPSASTASSPSLWPSAAPWSPRKSRSLSTPCFLCERSGYSLRPHHRRPEPAMKAIAGVPAMRSATLAVDWRLQTEAALFLRHEHQPAVRALPHPWA
jgi:hypothetical protein